MLGIGPGDIRLKELMQRLQGDVDEVIIATNSNLEGETLHLAKEKRIYLKSFKGFNGFEMFEDFGIDIEYSIT